MRVVSIPAHPSTYTEGRGAYSPCAIVVHYTGGRGLAGGETAEANGRYFAGGNRGASAHFFVDGSGTVVASVPEADTAWHAGNFRFNQMSIGIEVVSAGEDFTEGEIADLRELVQGLRRRYAIPPENVMRHYDCADFGERWGVGGSWVDPNKACPLPYVDHAKWHREVWACVAPDAPQGEAPAPEPGPAPEPSGGDFEGGLYRCRVGALNVRTGPGTGYPSVATYREGQTVELDGWYTVEGGYVWGRYTGAQSGEYRYVAVGPHTGEPESERDYLVKV